MEIIHNVLYTPLFSGVNMNANHTSDAIAIQGITCYAIQSIWTGFNADSAARINTFGSNDGINWTQVDSVTPSGAASNYLLNVEKAGYRFVQVAYIQSAGAGSLTVSISGKII